MRLLYLRYEVEDSDWKEYVVYVMYFDGWMFSEQGRELYSPFQGEVLLDKNHPDLLFQ